MYGNASSNVAALEISSSILKDQSMFGPDRRFASGSLSLIRSSAECCWAALVSSIKSHVILRQITCIHGEIGGPKMKVNMQIEFTRGGDFAERFQIGIPRLAAPKRKDYVAATGLRVADINARFVHFRFRKTERA